MSAFQTWQTGLLAAACLVLFATSWRDDRRMAALWGFLLPIDFVTGIEPEVLDALRYGGALWLFIRVKPDLGEPTRSRVRHLALVMASLAVVRTVMAAPKSDGNGTKFGLVLLAATAVGWAVANRTTIHRAVLGGMMAGLALSATVSVMQALHLTTIREGNIEGRRYPGLSTYTMLLTWQLAMGMVLAIAFLVSGRRGSRLWWAAAVVLPIFVVASLANGAQGGFVGLGAAFLAFLWTMRKQLDRRALTIVGAAAVAALALTVVLAATEAIDLSSITVLTQPKGLQNENARIDIARTGMEEFLENPLVGVSRSWFIEEYTIAPHFLPADSAAMAGILGLVVATYLIGYLVVLVLRGPRNHTAAAVTGYLALVVMVANTSTDSYGPFVGVSRAMPLFLAVAAASGHWANSDRGDPPGPGHPAAPEDLDVSASSAA